MSEQDSPQEKRLTFRLSRDLHRRIRIVAAKEETSINELVVRWLMEKVAQAEAAEPRSIL